MSGERNVRLALLGAAHLHAEAYAAALRTLPGVTLMGFSEPDPGRAERFARASGLKWRSQAELLFDRPDG
ncbi:MAG: Gfo/Idh/MocA family protein, partial [Deinococcus sp.]